MTSLIVVGVDGSAHSDAALRWSVSTAEALAAEVRAVFAWQLPFVSIPGAFDAKELEDAAKQFVRTRIAEVVPSVSVPIVTYVAEGDPAAVLDAAAQDADLLVVGVRGRSPFVGLVLGAVSQRVAATAPCPVVLVKPPR
jgi:nucleotide-binding universal stress UspA family protein